MQCWAGAQVCVQAQASAAHAAARCAATRQTIKPPNTKVVKYHQHPSDLSGTVAWGAGDSQKALCIFFNGIICDVVVSQRAGMQAQASAQAAVQVASS
jgi:hypothetical protein